MEISIESTVGDFGKDWTGMFAKEPHHYRIHRVVGVGDFAPSNQLSNEMDLPQISWRSTISTSFWHPEGAWCYRMCTMSRCGRDMYLVQG